MGNRSTKGNNRALFKYLNFLILNRKKRFIQPKDEIKRLKVCTLCARDYCFLNEVKQNNF